MILREVNRVGEVQKNVPKLRFKGYEDNWKHSELGEVLSELYNGQTPSRFREENWNGDINWLTSGELNRDIVYKTIEKITRIGQVDANLRIVPEGIFVMAITGLEAAGTRGNCAILGIPTTLNQSCMALFPKENILFTGFLFQWYKKNGEKYGLVYTQGTKQRSYNAELIKKLPIAFPVYNEQKKISIILRSLDHYLTLYQNRIEELQKMKKTLLLKMFPKNGEAVPEIRFKGFTDAWEQRKFMECINNVVDYRGKTPKKLGMNWSEEGFLALSALNVKDGYIDFELDANYGDIELYNVWMKQDLSKRQVVFTTEAPMGNVAQIPDDSKYILSQRVIAFEVAHEKITDDFLATLLKSPKVFDDLTSLATGGTAKGVSQRSLSKLSVKIPQIIEEQNKIAKIICTLNKAITLHQRKLDELKNMKKTLLQQMFV